MIFALLALTALGTAPHGHKAHSASPRQSSRDSLTSGYNPVSPHWQHIRTMMTDFYYNWTPAERAWAGRHYDFAMSGDANAWRAQNPTVQHYKYVLLQAAILPKTPGKGDLQSAWLPDMSRWYVAHPQFTLESAFLHQAGQPADSAHRLKPWGWATPTWIINPADAGLIAYTTDRFQRAAESEDGLFIDSQGSGDIAKNSKGSSEYPVPSKYPPELTGYFTPYAKLLATLKGALRTKTIMLNTGPYRFAPDSAFLAAAGATHMEKTNNPISSDLPATWVWIDKLLASGVFVDLVDAHDAADMPGVVKRGYATSVEDAFRRMKFAELASYYMVVPRAPDRLALQLVNMWDRPYPPLWLKAQEANIGHPTAVRRLENAGVIARDPVGQPVNVYTRDFDRALVIFRAQSGWGKQIYGDTTGVRFALPAGEKWLPLAPDGSVGDAVTSVSLRNGDAAIVVKASTIS